MHLTSKSAPKTPQNRPSPNHYVYFSLSDGAIRAYTITSEHHPISFADGLFEYVQLISIKYLCASLKEEPGMYLELEVGEAK